ncbi:MAG: molybdopterin molybdenumtransferase MoeA [Thermoprotei archaeon]|nr:MAG: molybdopterin molybdenumtransferase MoeA [Thermoprotei archaeon]RLF25828.1 MAG: molybdopterin molybdenumtransferase MoeA [Thermoprotei archaeon]
MGSRFLQELKEAHRIIEEVKGLACRVDDVIEVRTCDAIGHVLAEDVIAKIDYPLFNVSAMDGYAVRAHDIRGAGLTSPVRLKLVGEVKIGEKPTVEVREGEAVYIRTGGILPEGADVVVPEEYANLVGDEVEILAELPKYANVDLKGSFIKRGEVLLRKGHLMRSWDVALLLLIGHEEVKVYRKARVALIAVGSELFNPREVKGKVMEELLRGRVPEVSSMIITELLSSLPVQIFHEGILPDNVDILEKSLRSLLRAYDVVITLGGTGVSPDDVTYVAVKRLRPEYFVRGVAIRPGRPSGVALVEGKPVIMLSGYPLAAMIGCMALAEPILRIVCNLEEGVPKPVIRGVVVKPISSSPLVDHYVRVVVKKEGDKIVVEPLSIHGSSKLHSLCLSSGIVIVPRGKEGLGVGEEVEVILLKEIKS